MLGEARVLSILETDLYHDGNNREKKSFATRSHSIRVKMGTSNVPTMSEAGPKYPSGAVLGAPVNEIKPSLIIPGSP